MPIRRTTLAAERDDLDVLEREARRRKVSLAHVLRELVAREADALREKRAPHFAIFDSGGSDASDLTWRDEESPARGQLDP